MTATVPVANYGRTPSKYLRELVSPGGFLKPVIDLSSRAIKGLHLDVHFRSNDEIHVYCGLTRILRIRRNRNGTVTVSAHQAYSKQDCSRFLLRHWNTSEADAFREALEAYVAGVWVDERHVGREGRIQTDWSGITEPWTPFDREAVLGYRTREESKRAREIREVERARIALETHAESQRRSSGRSGGWSMPKDGGREVDLLAVDSEGRLVLVELKSTSANPAAIYYSPFQLLQYIWEWHSALESVIPQLQKALDARVELGMTTDSVPNLTGRLRAAVCFDWEITSGEVRTRYERVLEVVNGHLPEGVPAIETWNMGDVPSLVNTVKNYSPERSRSQMALFPASLQAHLEDWRGRVDGSTSKMWNHWTDGIYPDFRDLAQEVVLADEVRLHQYAAHLRSSQVFALNLFLPFRREHREELSERVTETIGARFSIHDVRFEWIPPGALLGEIEGGRPIGNEPATAVDVVLWGRLTNAGSAAVLLEVKLSETDFTHCAGRTSLANNRQDVCESAALFFENPMNCYLRRPLRRKRDRRYWEIFAATHGSVRAAFPGADTEDSCPFAYSMQQPMRNLAIAKGLAQDPDSDVEQAWFGLCAHDENQSVAGHWEEWRRLLPVTIPAPMIPASEIIRAGEAAGFTQWAAWMRSRYRL